MACDAASGPGVSHHVVDAAAGVTVYRGAAYPAKYYGNVFVGDPQNYRAKDEVQRYRDQHCCLRNFRERMQASGELDKVRQQAMARLLKDAER